MLLPPSPKSQVRDVTLPVEVSVKATVRGAGPAMGLALKAATGAGTTVIYAVFVSVSALPPGPVTVRVTV